MKTDGLEKGLTWVWRGLVVVLLVILIFRQSEILDGQPGTIPKPNSNVGGQLGSLSGNLSNRGGISWASRERCDGDIEVLAVNQFSAAAINCVLMRSW